MRLIDKINEKMKENETETPTLEKLKEYFKSLDYEYAEVLIHDEYASVTVPIQEKFPFDLNKCNRCFNKLGIENFICGNICMSFMIKIDSAKEWNF